MGPQFGAYIVEVKISLGRGTLKAAWRSRHPKHGIWRNCCVSLTAKVPYLHLTPYGASGERRLSHPASPQNHPSRAIITQVARRCAPLMDKLLPDSYFIRNHYVATSHPDQQVVSVQ